MAAVFLPYRLPAWIALPLFSLISLLSIIDDTRKNKADRLFEETWCLSLASASFGLAVMAGIVHGIQDVRDKFVSTKLEGLLIVLVFLIWVLAIPVVMAPQKGLAVVETRIVDANLYFSSWLAFACSLAMFASFGRDTGKLGDGMRYQAKYWICLLISSIITMSAAIRVFHNQKSCNANDKAEELCNELRLGISLSVISAVIAGVLVGLDVFVKTKTLPTVAVLIAALIVLVLWSVLVAYLTFDKGPGSVVGDLFFGTWISFLLSLCLAVSHISMTVPSSSASENTPAKTGSTEKKITAKKKPEQAV